MTSYKGHFKSTDARDKINNFIKFVESFGQKDFLFNGNRVSTYHGNANRWTLRNNIILDANAGLDKWYYYAKDMIVKGHPVWLHCLRSYQAIKRINRECNDPADMFVVNGNPAVFNTVTPSQ